MTEDQKDKEETKVHTSKGRTWPMNFRWSASKHTNGGENWGNKKAGWRNSLSGETKSKWWSNAWEYRRGKTAVGVTASPPNWPLFKLSQKRKNVKKPEQFSNSSAKKGEDERFGLTVLAHLNHAFNSLNVLLDLAEGPALSQEAAGSLLQTLPSLLQRWWTSIALAALWP